ncbi:hypothetical protein FRB96_001354 [Tulasnella sp. 330]|nr:hypothetical protein FRB96_001354 [Tulasnella sp. 330]KAG8878518.1 hypothetical protein FRB97_002428 [Tulasnella sp. 331]
MATSTSSKIKVTSPTASSSPKYAKGDKVLLSNHVISGISAFPQSMVDPMNLLRGRIVDVVSTRTSNRYKAEIITTIAELTEEVAFGDVPPATICVEVDERDVISQLSPGQDFPDVKLTSHHGGKKGDVLPPKA